jgi:hypothetical protein
MRRTRLLAGWTAVDYLLAAANAAVVLAVIVVGYAFFGPQTLAGGVEAPSTEPPNHIGLASGVIRVTIEDVSCCYMEGAVRVVQLDGPTSDEWAVGDRSEARVATGRYTLTAFEHVCNGSCGWLDPPTNHCEIDLDVASGDVVDVLVTFPIPAPCHVEVGGPAGESAFEPSRARIRSQDG